MAEPAELPDDTAEWTDEDVRRELHFIVGFGDLPEDIGNAWADKVRAEAERRRISG